MSDRTFSLYPSWRLALSICLSLLFAVLTAWVWPTPAVWAQTGAVLTVNQLGDTTDGSCTPDHCTLREAITVANNIAGDDTIVFNMSASSIITLSSQLPSIQGVLTVDGAAVNGLTISGNNAVRHFYISPGATLTIKNFNLKDGKAYDPTPDRQAGDLGGAINNDGALFAENIWFFDNRSVEGAGGAIYSTGTAQVSNSQFRYNSATWGGAIESSSPTAVLTVTNTLFRSNEASDGGGAIWNGTGGGVVFISGSTFFENKGRGDGGSFGATLNTFQSIVNSTFFYNDANRNGGGIFNQGTLTVRNSTIAGNFARFGQGGGVYNAATTTLYNTILSGNFLGLSATVRSNCAGVIVNGGNNIDSIADCNFANNNHSQSNIDPRLDFMDNYGGGTPTLALMPDSPALNAGNDAICADTATVNNRDQRGIVRPQGLHCDIGAYERLVPNNQPGTTLIVNQTTDTSDGICDTTHCTLREALLTPGNNTIQFNLSYPTTITLNSSLPIIFASITILGPGADKLTINGNQYSLFAILDNLTVMLSKLTLYNGVGDKGVYGGSLQRGGAVKNYGSLAILDSRLIGNASFWGGAIFNSGLLTLTNSTLSDNRSDTGGGIYNRDGTVTIEHSLIAHNVSEQTGGIYSGSSTLTINNSTIRDNKAASQVPFSGGLYSIDGTVSINNSLISRNHIEYENPGSPESLICPCGGGVYISGSRLEINNSTVSENFINAKDPHEYTSGGIFNDGTTTVHNTTIKDNYTLTGRGYDNIMSRYENNQAVMIAHNTIIVDNQNPTLASCSNVTDGGHNLDSGNSCGLSAATGSLINTDPKLAPLANNGGDTQTHALQAGSPAIDAGNDIICGDLETVNYHDQRGVSRPQGVRCDIGAYEYIHSKEIQIAEKGLPITTRAFPLELEGSNDPTPLSLTIDNARSTGSFAWSAQTDAEWLQPSPAFGASTPATIKLAASIQSLAPGVYTAHLLVTSADPSVINQHYTLTVTIEIVTKNNNVPILRVNLGTLGFDAVVGEGNPAAQSFTVENLGGGVLTWQAAVSAEAQAWLTLNGTSTANGNAPATVPVAVNSNGLSPGIYVGTITVNNASMSPQIVTVVLNVQLGPTLAFTNPKLVFVGRKNVNEPIPQSVGIRNAGAGTFSWSASENSNWLSVNPIAPGLPGTLEATAKIAGLNVGTYNDQIIVSSATAAGSPAKVDVVLGVLLGPVLAVDQQRLALDTIFGRNNPTSGQIRLRNAGYGTLEWSASENIPWLELAQSSGQIGSGSAFVLNAAVVGVMPVGVYTGQILMSSSNGDASPQVVNVILTVASPVAYCNIQSGEISLLDTTMAKMKVKNVTVMHTDTGCHLAGQMQLNLPQNANLVANIEGDARVENGKALFSASASSELVLEIANLKLQLAKQNLVFREELGLTLNTANWELPPLFGGGVQAFGAQMTISPQGITISGQRTFDLPNLNWGSFSITNNKAEVQFSGDGQYLLLVDGLVNMSIPGSGNVTSNISLMLNKDGIRTGTITRFNIQKFAGLDLAIEDADLNSEGLSVRSAKLQVPKEWGGASGAIYNLKISNNGAISVGGGEFRLPDINSGGGAFTISNVYGKVLPRNGGGYQIEAGGTFGMAGLPNGNSCKMGVRIVLHTGNDGASVMEIASVAAAPSATTLSDALDGLQLERFTLDIHCRPGWPIATTGFSLTGVRGEISLVRGKEYVQITIWIESDWNFGGTPVVSAEPGVTFYPQPFRIEFQAPIKVLGFKATQSDVKIDAARFHVGLSFDIKLLHAGFTLDAGLEQRKFFLRGSGWAEVAIEKGSIARECVLNACVAIPDRKYVLDRTDAYFDLDVVKLSKRVLGYKISLEYDFHSGNIYIDAGLLTQTVTGAQIAAARQTGIYSAAATDQPIAFANDDVALIELTVPSFAPEVQAADVTSPFANIPRSDVLFILVQPATSTLQFNLIDPAGQEISPGALPANIYYEQTGGLTTTQTLYSVTEATPGTWKTKVIGDTDGRTDFFVYYQVNTPQPLLSDLYLANTANPSQVQVNWRLAAAEANTKIAIYAAIPPLTQTISYTNADNEVVTANAPNFSGERLVADLASATNGIGQNQLLDVSTLPSGQYAFWLEASGPNGGSTRCFMGLDGTCDTTGLNATTYQINHAPTVAASGVWSPAIDTFLEIQQGSLSVTWEPHPHPDVDNYYLRLRTTDPLDPSVEIKREYLIGPIGVDRGYASVSNIEPGQTYYLSIGAEDSYHQVTYWSGETPVVAPQPEFLINLPAAEATGAAVEQTVLHPGGTPVPVSFQLELASDLPYPVALGIDPERLPDGINVTFDRDLVTTEQSQAKVVASISASDTLLPGQYVVPIIARSGFLEHSLNLIVTITPADSTPTNQRLYLPLINR